jgi:riboflavin kinase/FMN adenylyltransferase
MKPAAMPHFTVIRDDTPAIAIPRGAVVALGNFDGVHLGHRVVLKTAQDMAARRGAAAMAVTFEPHPRSFFNPNTPQFRLTDARARLRLMAGAGLSGAVVMTFDATRAGTSAEDFVVRDLVERLAVSGVVAGYDFHFGKGRRGSPDLLRATGRTFGFEVFIQPHVDLDGRAVSSTAIRNALGQGEVAEANTLLGYPWFVSGEVVHGEKRGRDLGYPTANLRLDPACGLRHGIYAVRVGLNGARHHGVASFGRRPTFDNGAPLLEIHLLDYAGDLYGQTLDVAFIGFLREELKFDDVGALVRQMDDDSARARARLVAQPDAFPVLGRID